jgi:hypothetical protein
VEQTLVPMTPMLLHDGLPGWVHPSKLLYCQLVIIAAASIVIMLGTHILFHPKYHSLLLPPS